MLFDVELHCDKWKNCKTKWCNGDGGFWCKEDCKLLQVRPITRKRKVEKIVNGGVVAMRNLTNMLYQHFTMIPARIGRREMTRNEAIKYAKENILAYTSEMAEFKVLAIDALEKQIPKKPIFSHNLSDTLSVFHCECGNTIKVSHDAGIMNNNNAANYCSKCGCRLDWSDAE